MREGRPPRFVAGDPLRAIAAVSVVVYHYSFFGIFRPGDWFSDVYGTVPGRALGSLELGLYIFFVLSGYLIAGPFVRAFVTGAPLPRIGRYFRNRALRIIPPFWIVFAVLLLIQGSYASSDREIAAVFLFAQNYDHSPASFLVGPAWTLDIEVLFYALVPITAALLLRLRPRMGSERDRMRVVVLAAAVVWVASIAVREVVPDHFQWQRAFPAMVFAFMPGIGLACAEMAWSVRAKAAAPKRLPAYLFAGGLVFWALYAATAPEQAFPPLTGAGAALLASLASTLLVAAPMVLQWQGASQPRVLDNRVMHWIGERSYGLYLIHAGALSTLAEWITFSDSETTRFAQALLLGLPVSLLAAALLFAVVERPILARRLPWRTAVRSASDGPRAAPLR